MSGSLSLLGLAVGAGVAPAAATWLRAFVLVLSVVSIITVRRTKRPWLLYSLPMAGIGLMTLSFTI